MCPFFFRLGLLFPLPFRLSRSLFFLLGRYLARSEARFGDITRRHVRLVFRDVTVGIHVRLLQYFEEFFLFIPVVKVELGPFFWGYQLFQVGNDLL